MSFYRKFIKNYIPIVMIFLAGALPAQSAGSAGGAGGAEGARVALVIGNSAYQHVSELRNPVNDAADIGATLETLGFSVNRVLDASKGEIQRAVDEFQSAASRRGTEMALFYYSGHGVEYEGVNYIIPVTAEISDEYQLVDQAVSLDRVVTAMDRGSAEFNMVVLDACRDNPFFRTRSAGSRGLAAMSGGGKGSMIVFATSPGDVAQDGSGRNSPFTQAFMEHAPTPGIEVSTLMRRINGTVQELTGGAQTPWFNASYTGEVFLSAAEDLANASARTDAINDELAALEAEIARRQAEIESARSGEEKERLEAEQRRARAEEAAKRLQAQQLAEIAKAAETALLQQQANERLRDDMAQEFASQQASLSRQAQERRAELEQLRLQTDEGAGLYERLTTISRMNAAISDINSRFDESVTRTMEELQRLYQERLASLEQANPMDPWESPEEWEARLSVLRQEVDRERAADESARREELETGRREELAPLKLQLDIARSDLSGREFFFGGGETRVTVHDFDVYEKHFPVTVAATDESVPLTADLSYAITSRDRDVLRSEYYRVFSADRAGGLSGSFRYRAYEVYPDIWAVVPQEVTVLNLLEDDAILLTADRGGEILFHTGSGIVPKRLFAVALLEMEEPSMLQSSLTILEDSHHNRFLVADSQEQMRSTRIAAQWGNRSRSVTVSLRPGINPPVHLASDGAAGNGGSLLVAVTGAAPETTVLVNGGEIPVTGEPALVVVPADIRTVTIRNPFIAWPVQRQVIAEDTSIVWLNVAAETAPIHGIVDIPSFSGTLAVFDSRGNQIKDGRVTREYGTGDGYRIPLPPGTYQIATALQEDDYFSDVQDVSVSSGEYSRLPRALQPVLSTRYRLDQKQAEFGLVERRLSTGRPYRIGSRVLLGAGAVGLVGTAYSYLQGSVARSDYDDAGVSPQALELRSEAQSWGVRFSISAIATALTTAGGVTLFALGPDQRDLIDERNDLRRTIDALSARTAAEAATNPILGLPVSGRGGK